MMGKNLMLYFQTHLPIRVKCTKWIPPNWNCWCLLTVQIFTIGIEWLTEIAKRHSQELDREVRSDRWISAVATLPTQDPTSTTMTLPTKQPHLYHNNPPYPGPHISTTTTLPTQNPTSLPQRPSLPRTPHLYHNDPPYPGPHISTTTTLPTQQPTSLPQRPSHSMLDELVEIAIQEVSNDKNLQFC